MSISCDFSSISLEIKQTGIAKGLGMVNWKVPRIRLAMLGGEGDGQVAYEAHIVGYIAAQQAATLQDFRTLFAPKSAVLAEMLTMAPQEAEEARLLQNSTAQDCLDQLC